MASLRKTVVMDNEVVLTSWVHHQRHGLLPYIAHPLKKLFYCHDIAPVSSARTSAPLDDAPEDRNICQHNCT